MKKFLVFVLAIALILSSSSLLACSNVKFLEEKVTLSKTDILEEEKNSIKLTCHKLWQKSNGEKAYYFKFSLSGEVSPTLSYSISFNLNGKEYKENFTFNPISNALTSLVKTDKNNEKTLSATLLCGDKAESYNLASIIDKELISISTALVNLKDKVPSLISAYTDKNGNFIADIIFKISVINTNYYYYVEFNGENVKTVAFLINAVTGEVLAVRNAK